MMAASVGILDIDILVRIRKSFRLRWRIPTLAAFWLLVFALWMGPIVRATPGEFFPETHQVETAVLWILLSLVTLRASFRRDAFARTFFGVTSGFVGLFVVLYLFLRPLRSVAMERNVSMGEPKYVGLLVGGVFVGLLLVWYFVIRTSIALLLSVIPLGSGKSVRQQVRSTLAADAARKTAARELKKLGAKNAPSSRPALVMFLTVGVLFFIVGQYFLSLALTAMAFEESQSALMNGRYAEFATLATNFHPAEEQSWSEDVHVGVRVIPLGTAGLLCLVAFAFLWHRWQRSKISLNRAEPNTPIPPDGVLLMRHSKDEVMRIPKRVMTLTRLPFMLYELNYTFEELIGSRLSFVGSMVSLDTPRRFVPIIDPVRGWLKNRARSGHGVVRWSLLLLARLRRRLQIRFPPPGGAHFRSDNTEWTAVIAENLPKARAVVLIIGEAKNGHLVSQGLQAEMRLIKERGFLAKSVFLMPPLMFNSSIRARWKAFCDYLPNAAAIAGLLPKAKRVLGVCFINGDPVVITGSQRTEFHYQSVLDIAGTLAGGTGPEEQLMITKWRPKQRPSAAVTEVVVTERTVEGGGGS